MHSFPLLIQQFARYPQPGRVKTRLAASIGKDEACAVHLDLLARTARTLLSARLGPVELWLDGAGPHPLFEVLRRDGLASIREQVGADLGERMADAIASGLTRADAVLLVGSDCPGIDERYLQAARDALDRADVVIGPAEDGGYVLVAMREAHGVLFREINWGSDRVLSETCQRAEEAGLSLHRLEMRYDIDELRDLERWRAEES